MRPTSLLRLSSFAPCWVNFVLSYRGHCQTQKMS